MSDEPLREPGPEHKTAIVGRTGSGKTFAAVWLLSRSDFDERPWVVLDYKDDELLNSIARAEPLDLDDELPELPGIYILKILPGDKERVDDWFKRVWEREDMGVLVDEGYMVDQRGDWFNACLTQGRSKRVSMVILSQRPVWLSRFVFSESDFFFVFDLTHEDDLNTVSKFIKDDDRELLAQELEPHHFHYYDVGKKRIETLSPVPPGDQLLATIDARLALLDLLDEDGNPPPRRRAL
jgi:DNA helicase HerA-like ATPase